MSLLDRPISEFDGAARFGARSRWCSPIATCKPFQEVLIELGARLGLPGVLTTTARRAIRRLPATSSSSTNARRASAFSPAGAARTATKHCAASRIRSSGNVQRATTASASRDAARPARYINWQPRVPRIGRSAMRLAARRRADPARRSIREVLQRFRLAGARARRRRSRRTSRTRDASRRYFDPLPFWYPPLEDAATDRARRIRCRDHAAADGDVSLVGFAERVAAADPRAQLPVRQSAHGDAARHRRRRLDLGRIAAGHGALQVRLQRRRRARHGVDVERDRQAQAARGSLPPTRRRARRASCSIT